MAVGANSAKYYLLLDVVTNELGNGRFVCISAYSSDDDYGRIYGHINNFSIILLPIVEYQMVFWGLAVATVFIGDSLTTGLLGKFDLEEQEIGYTRWACGAEPTMYCSFLTRGIILAFAGALYFVVLRTGFGLQFTVVAISVLSLPIILATGGFAATVINSYSIFRSTRHS